MTRKIRKAIIPAAGYGTGFLPATKAFAKEMLPIVDKPIIQFIVEEAIEAGIEEILIITGKTKRPIEDHFDSNIELEENLRSKGKDDLLELVHQTIQTNLFFVRQSYPTGLGGAIMEAKAFVGEEPFVVMLGDNIMSSSSMTKRLMDLYEKTGVANIAVQEVSESERNQMGVVELGKEYLPNVHHIKKLVEKPTIEETESRQAILGRYVLTPHIFDHIERLAPGKEGEIQLTDALNEYNKTQRLFAVEVDDERHDVGNKLGYLELSIQYGLQHPETAEGLRTYLRELTKALSEEKNKQ